MGVGLVYDTSFETYDFGHGHPLRPERFSLAVLLMEHWGLLGNDESALADDPPIASETPRALVIAPGRYSEEDLLLIHSSEYVEAVKQAGANPRNAQGRYGLGAGDTPAFQGMHEAASLAVAASITALDTVLDDRMQRTFSPAGGLHHALRDRASGFCIYNDCAVAIARAVHERPGLRLAYVDIDAHHGDGVEAAFARSPDVLTVSIHESGQYLFPGTGAARDIGQEEGLGYALNVPLPPGAGPDEMARAFDEVVVPAVRSFAPDAIVAQLGADSHYSDPLTHLENTVSGHVSLVQRIVDLADEVCAGRLAATGGGGYLPFTVVPRMWGAAMAVLLGRPVPHEVPAVWLEAANAAARAAHVPESDSRLTYFDEPHVRDAETVKYAADMTARAIEAARAASPLA